MPNIRFLNTNRFTAATLTASAAQEGAPAAASQDPDRNYQWVSGDSTGTRELEIDLGSVLECSAVALADADELGGSDIELYHRGDGASPGTAVLVATLPAPNSDRRTAFAFFTAASHRHWQLKWTNTGAVNASATLGYGFLGTYFEPAINVSSPIEIADVLPDEIVRSIDRQRRTVARTPFAAGRWVWDDVFTADRDAITAMHKAAGVAVPMFVVLDTALAWTCYLHWLGPALQTRVGIVPGQYSLDVDWEEAT